ncbi:MAG: DNA mismatch repair endonuclease MutL [Clostridiales bacterium]|nr:DNA mismatch repair endonuclease MutL [Clostridiales bacterium]
MSSIHLLDENTINQIAAGEVVERPSAVVKELVENAMDAKATAITVEIKDGGLSFIRVTDNGTGIARDDIPLAFMRHATSKIYMAEDLLCIKSLGFRGEALSSIAAVAQVELITKTSSALNGYRYIIEGGVEKSIEEIGCPSGTTILVRNLFYNTPARRKFLKSATTEAGYIGDLMEKILVAHPEVSFKYIVNNQIKLQSSGNNNTKDILYSIFGRDIASQLLILGHEGDKVKINGYIAKPGISRSNRAFENYFINGRYIKNHIITKAIEDAYKPFLMQHKYPFTSIYLEIEPSLIDVNVHPQKMELRLRNGEEIYQLLYNLIRNTLSNNELIPRVSLSEPGGGKADRTDDMQAVSMPEPFETNRRTYMQEQAAGRYEYEHSKGRNMYQRLADKNADYLSATRPLIQADIEIPGLLKPNNDQSIDTANPAEREAAGNQELVSGKGNFKDAAGTESSDPEAVNRYSDASADTENPNPGTEGPEAVTTTGNTDAVVTAGNASSGNTEATTVEENIKEAAGLSEAAADAGSRRLVAEQMTLFDSAASDDQTPFISGKAMEEHKIIGQLFNTYWLVEYKRELYIIDQHAAHEKVLYERLMAAAKNKAFHSQQLMPPLVLTLTLKEQEVINKHEDVLRQLGYEFEHFGGNEYSIRAVPADLYSLSEKVLLLEFIDELAEEAMSNIGSSTSILEKIASISCKAAVKANHAMSYDEALTLIKELLTLENPYNCPHGRPVIISMSQYELERKFKRII